jgi:hypothetical protein
MPERPLPTEKEVRALIRDRRNWGRWGKDGSPARGGASR